MGPLPIFVRQFKFIMVAVEYFTKWVEAEPLTTITVEKISKFIWRPINREAYLMLLYTNCVRVCEHCLSKPWSYLVSVVSLKWRHLHLSWIQFTIQVTCSFTIPPSPKFPFTHLFPFHFHSYF